MDVEVPPDGVEGDKVGEATLYGGLYLAPVLPQLGLNPFHAQYTINLLLGLACDPPVGVALEEAVLVELVPLLDGDGPQLYVMLLRACEVLEG
jgi:hypothetical protein